MNTGSIRSRIRLIAQPYLAVLVCILGLPYALHAQDLSHNWSERFGDASLQRGYGVATDGSGNMIVAGAFLGTVDFGGGPLTDLGDGDIFVAKFDPSGNHIWSQRFGDASEQWSEAIVVDQAGNVIVTGGMAGTVDFGGGPLVSSGDNDIFVAKFGAGGNHIWSQRFGDPSEQYGKGVAADGLGNVIVTGRMVGNADFGGGLLIGDGQPDIFVAKFDSSGNHLWSERFGDTNLQWGRSVATDGSGNMIITGRLKGTVDFGGGPLTAAINENIFVAKFGPSGNHIWSQRFGEGSCIAWGSSVSVDGLGNVIVSGPFWGSVNFGGGLLWTAGRFDTYIAKFDPSGNHIWSKRFGDGEDSSSHGVAVDGSWNVIITGSMEGTVDFGGGPLTCSGEHDIYIAKFDRDGNHIWSERFGDASDQWSRSVAIDGAGNAVLTGAMEGSADFGGGPLASGGGDDIFVAKFGVSCPAVDSGALLFAELYTTDANTISLPLGEPYVYKSSSFKITRHANEAVYISGAPDTIDALVCDDDIRVNGHSIGGGPYTIIDPAFPRGVPIETVLEPIAAPAIPESVIPVGTGCYRFDLVDTQREIYGNTDIYIIVRSTLTDVPDLGQETYFPILHQNYPNPFNPVTVIRYDLPEPQRVTIKIYDISGQLVRVLRDARYEESGRQEATWYGMDETYRRVASGTYVYQLTAGPYKETKRMTLVR